MSEESKDNKAIEKEFYEIFEKEEENMEKEAKIAFIKGVRSTKGFQNHDIKQILTLFSSSVNKLSTGKSLEYRYKDYGSSLKFLTMFIEKIANEDYFNLKKAIDENWDNNFINICKKLKEYMYLTGENIDTKIISKRISRLAKTGKINNDIKKFISKVAATLA